MPACGARRGVRARPERTALTERTGPRRMSWCAPPRHKSVVVRHFTANAARSRMSRQPQRPQDPISTATCSPHTRTDCRDHGSTAGGAWRNESEPPPGTVIMGSVLLGQQPAHDHDGDRRGGRHDHGSGAPGGCDAKSEAALPAAAPPGNRPVISSARTNQAIRAPNRAEVMKSRDDHGSTAGGAASLP